MKVWFSEFFMYFLKVLSINARGLRKISVRANVPDECNLITVICSGFLIFRPVAEPQISSKSVKSREIHIPRNSQNTRNPAKFARNLTKLIHVSTTNLKVILAVGAAYLL